MATACVAFPVADIRDVRYHRQRIRIPSRTGLDNASRQIEEDGVGTCTRITRRCDSAHNACCPSTPTSRSTVSTSSTYRKAFALVAELLLSIPRLPQPLGDDRLSDAAVQTLHHESQPLAHARVEAATSAPARVDIETDRQDSELLQNPTMPDPINFGDAAGIQTRAKKDKKAAKKAQQAKWAGSDNEDGTKNGDGGNEGEEGGGVGGGGDGGSGAGGNGHGGGGGAGGDGDDWDFGGKKNKKNKKNKKQEEEEKAAQEEEKKKTKAEEDEAAANALGWANETSDPKMDDEWATLSNKKEKKKKGKKGAEETASAAPEPPTAAFHEISLDDGAPQLDFNFGGSDAKKDTGIGGFDAWGKTWDFASIGTAAAGEKKDDKTAKAEKDKENDGKDSSADLGVNNPWSFGTKSKGKKKTTITSGFDFGDFGASQDHPDIDLGLIGATESKPIEEDTWGFSAVNKKGKKTKGKDAVEEKKEEAVTALPEPENEKEVADSWGAWGANNKDKKKSKKVAADEDTSIPASGPRDAIVDGGDEWASFGAGKKEKKKGAKAASEDPMLEKKTEALAAEAQSTFDWSPPASKKDKKNKKKGLVNEVEDDPIVSIEDAATGDITAAGDDDWMKSAWTTGSKKKDKKGPRSTTAELTDGPESTTAAETNTTASGTVIGEEDWGSSTTKSKKEKKARKGDNKVTDIPPVPPPPVPEIVEEDSGWGTFGKKEQKGGKKGKTTVPEPVVKDPEPVIEQVEEIKEESSWGTWGMSAKDKKKKEKDAKKKEPPEPSEPVVKDPEPNEEQVGEIKEESSWGTWGMSAKDKKKKEKDAKRKEPPKPPEPSEPVVKDPEPIEEQVEEIKEESSWGTWGMSAKDKKKKEKDAKKKKEPPEPVVEVPEPNEDVDEEIKEESSWGTWGMSAKDKKKETDAKKKEAPDPAAQTPAKAVEEENPAEDDIWGSFATTKKKNGKKSKDEPPPPPPAPTPPAQGLTPEPGPAAMPEFEMDGWGELTSTKIKSTTKKGPLSRSTTLTGKTSKSDDTKAKSKDVKEEKGEPITSPKDEKPSSKKDVITEETPAKAVKSMWGSFGGTTTSTAKTKLAKEKEKKAEEEKAKQEAEAAALEEAEAAALLEAEEAAFQEAEAAALREASPEPVEAPKKSSKSKAGSKTSKVGTKLSEKTDDKKKRADEAALFNILDEPSPKEETPTSKPKKSVAKTPKDKKAKEAEIKEEKQADDYFGFWGSGSTKKTAGQKDEETKKEIDNQGWANEMDALAGFPNDLEGPVADEPIPTPKSSKTMSTTATKSKSTAASSVAARIKALEANKKEEKAEKLKAEIQLAKDIATARPEVESPQEEKKKEPLNKSKGASASTSKSTKKKEVSPPVEEKKSKETVPGSFPGAFGDDDDLMALDDFQPAPEKTSAKKAKDDKKVTTKSTADKMEDLLVEASESPRMPTPPPEEKKPVKKERARVERTGAASSWGLWGAAPTPKKDSAKRGIAKQVDEGLILTPPKKKTAAPAGFTRSKSTKTPKEKDRDDKKDAEKVSKSSSSDTKEKRPEARPAKPSRGMSFSAFMMGGPPPSATKAKPAVRRSSVAGGLKSVSRRQSVDVDAGGLMSPPPEDQPQTSDKAAKLMGVKGAKLDRTKSSKGKEKASVVPDPYPIDDEDMVMVNGLEDPLLNGASSKNPPKEKLSKNKSKRVSKPTKPRARTLSNDDDDVVMVEAGPSGGEAFTTSGPDDMAFVEHSVPELKRSNTTAKKTGGFFGGFFGGGSKAEKAPEPVLRSIPTPLYKDERMIDVEPLPSRTKDKSKRRSVKPYHPDVEILDQPDFDPEAEARRVDRRAARESEEAERAGRRKLRQEQEKAELEARRSKARDRARKEQEAEEQRREDKRSRRLAREEARAKEEADVEAAAAARRDERRRLRVELEASELEKTRLAAAAEGQDEGGVGKIRRSAKEDRREQFEREEEERLRRREEKKGKSSPRDKDKSGSSGKRKSATNTPMMDEYFESRNPSNTLKSRPGLPTDRASSWVKSQASDPPDLPPVEGTILDGEKPRSVERDPDRASRDRNRDRERGGRGGEERRRSSKKDPLSFSSRRRRDEADPAADDGARRSSRRKESRRSTAAAPFSPTRDREREDYGIRSGSGSGGDHAGGGGPMGGRHRSSRRRETSVQQQLGGEYDPYAERDVGVGFRASDGGVMGNSGGKRNSILGRLGGFL